MSFPPPQIENLREDAIAAAKAAAETILRFRRADLKVQRKAGGSLASTVVTEVDVLAQTEILKILMPSMKRFDIALLSEEQPDDRARLDKEYFWCVDPLDGTLPFIERTPGYSVSISLISHDGTPCIGVILDPENDVMYHATMGKGAFRNNERWVPNVAMNTSGHPLTAVFDRSTMAESNFPQICAELEIVAHYFGCTGLDVVNFGGAAMNACYTLEHAPACYIKLPRDLDSGGSLWDYGASACIFTECGAIATDVHGHALDLNRTDSTFMNHRGFIYATHTGIAPRLQGVLAALL